MFFSTFIKIIISHNYSLLYLKQNTDEILKIFKLILKLKSLKHTFKLSTPKSNFNDVKNYKIICVLKTRTDFI